MRIRTLALSLLVASLLVPAAAPLSASSDKASAQLSFGVNMARRGLWNEALFRFRQAASLDPDNPRILNNLAVAYEALGRFDQALEAYQKAVRLDPGNRELKANYTRFLEFYQAYTKPQEKPAEPPPSPPTNRTPSAE